ncbi:MAG: Smr/MutS family protein [Bacteroidota bacterium]
MSFKKGDKVIFVNDTGRGKVLDVLSDGMLVVEDENGFDYRVKPSEVMKEQGNLNKVIDQIDEYDVLVAASKDQQKMSKLDQQILHAEPYAKYSPDVMEVDLHIENLVDLPKKLEPGQIVETQLRVFERMLEKAIEQRKRKAIFIHGVGQGVLRAEIRKLLEYYPNVIVQDASYKEYGYGATEVVIRQR